LREKGLWVQGLLPAYLNAPACTAAQPVQFRLAPGQLLHVTGPNGVGKTRLLKLIAGLTPFEASGKLVWQGQPLAQGLRTSIGACLYIGHKPPLKAGLTVVAQLKQDSVLRRAPCKLPIEKALENSGLDGISHVFQEKLSAGQRQRVALLRLLLFPADLWLLDEPDTHLDKDAKQWLATCIRTQLQAGGMVILVSHGAHLPGLSTQQTVRLPLAFPQVC